MEIEACCALVVIAGPFRLIAPETRSAGTEIAVKEAYLFLRGQTDSILTVSWQAILSLYWREFCSAVNSLTIFRVMITQF